MEPQNCVPLTASEMANLWASYMSDTMSRCVLQYFLANTGDAEIRPVVENALLAANQHIETATTIFIKDKLTIPAGFSDTDVNLNAPRLYSDVFYLDYLKNMGKVGLATYAFAISSSAREDIRSFYEQCSIDATNIFQMAVRVAQSKGVFVRDPAISAPEKIRRSGFYLVLYEVCYWPVSSAHQA